MKVFGFLFLLLAANTGMQWQVNAQVEITEHTFGDLKARNLGSALMSGRISCIDALQADPRLVYFGSASGGLWKSTNGGVITKPIFDKHTQSIGAVCLDQQRPDTVWVGTGEPWTRNSVSIGTGVYKSTDGGENWKKMGLGQTERIARIIIHPENPDIVFVAALGHLWGPNEERGLFRSIDGGQTWEKKLYIDENTGCSDVDIDPENPDVLYAGMWQFRRRAWDFNSGGPGSGLYKSSDGGETWEELTTGLPEGNKGRIAVRVSPAAGHVVYALVESDNTAFYRSNDSGRNWVLMNNNPNIRERPFYFCLVVPDPVDTNRVYKPGFNLNVSEDGGKKFRTTYFAGGAIHPDFHALWISGDNPAFMYAGTDGGAYFSNDFGSSWRHIRNIPVSQFYKVSVDMKKPYWVYGGLQDNGSWMAPSRAPGGIKNGHWQETGAGDGFSVYADKEDENLIYWQIQGGIFAQTDKRDNSWRFIAPQEDEQTGNLRFNWDAAIHVSPSSNTVYVGAQYLFKSIDQGGTWERISPDLTTNDPKKQRQEESGGLTIDNSTAENHTTIFCIAESALDQQLLWVGTDDGNLQISRDGGTNWVNVSGNIPGLPSFTWCSSVYPSRFDKGTAYATFDGHRSNDINPYVFKTTDYGNTWIPLADDNIKAHCYKILEDPVNPNLLFLGTEFGLYISIDGGAQWAQFKGDLPNVSVMDMVIHPREHDLVLGTHGRGVYIIDDLTPLRHLGPEVLEKDFTFLPNRALRSINAQRLTLPTYTGDDQYTGRNPNTAIPITYYMKKRHIFGKMGIEVFDAHGGKLADLAAVSRKGINRTYWIPNLPQPRAPKSEAIPSFYLLIPPEYPPGDYKVKVSKGKDTYETTVSVHKPDDSRHTHADRQLKRETVMKAYRLIEDLGFLDRQISDVLEQSGKHSSHDKIKGSTRKKIAVLSDELNELRSRLLVTDYGDLRGSQELREKLVFLYGSMVLYPGRPSEGQLSRLEMLTTETRSMEKEFLTIQERYNAINKALEKAELDPIRTTTREAFDAEIVKD